MQVKAVQVAAHGPSSNMKLVDLTIGQPGPGEVLIRHKACGLNYIDVYQRTGLYPCPCR
jgi:NADPH:quinone reductase